MTMYRKHAIKRYNVTNDVLLDEIQLVKVSYIDATLDFNKKLRRARSVLKLRLYKSTNFAIFLKNLRNCKRIILLYCGTANWIHNKWDMSVPSNNRIVNLVKMVWRFWFVHSLVKRGIGPFITTPNVYVAKYQKLSDVGYISHSWSPKAVMVTYSTSPGRSRLSSFGAKIASLVRVVASRRSKRNWRPSEAALLANFGFQVYDVIGSCLGSRFWYNQRLYIGLRSRERGKVYGH